MFIARLSDKSYVFVFTEVCDFRYSFYDSFYDNPSYVLNSPFFLVKAEGTVNFFCRTWRKTGLYLYYGEEKDPFIGISSIFVTIHERFWNHGYHG